MAGVCRALTVVALPRLAGGANAASALDQALCLQAARRRGLSAGPAAITDGQTSYQTAQALGTRHRRGVDIRI